MAGADVAVVTIWPARRSGNRVLCGRTSPLDGQYVCQGEMAQIRLAYGGAADDWTDAAEQEQIVLPPGMTQDPPRSRNWRLTSKAQRAPEGGRRPVGQKRHQGDGGTTMVGPWEAPSLPFRRRCPHCNVMGEIQRDLVA